MAIIRVLIEKTIVFALRFGVLERCITVFAFRITLVIRVLRGCYFNLMFPLLSFCKKTSNLKIIEIVPKNPSLFSFSRFFWKVVFLSRARSLVLRIPSMIITPCPRGLAKLMRTILFHFANYITIILFILFTGYSAFPSKNSAFLTFPSLCLVHR